VCVLAPTPPLRAWADPDRLLEVVRMRAAAGEDDRVGAPLLELVVVPRGALGPLVLRVAHLGGAALERLRRRRGVEHQLDHLPVRLVLVVPVVEGVVEPVLACQSVAPRE